MRTKLVRWATLLVAVIFAVIFAAILTADSPEVELPPEEVIELPSEVAEWGFTPEREVLLRYTVFNNTDELVHAICFIWTLDANADNKEADSYRSDEIIQAGGSEEYQVITAIKLEGFNTPEDAGADFIADVATDCWVNE
ncbi:hypothetical protein LCGC14_2325670 [marine sediment metagenome]|uniref:Uncharacterized protein n=1 Tax=marine sediment metagenome TaxID=412755 RepID=A0A0F9ETY1_9ZZZZ